MIKRLFWLTSAILALAVTGCEKNVAEREEAPDFTILPSEETLSGTDIETRTHRGPEYKVLWNADDLVSLFLKVTANRKYKFMGETGDNGGMLSPAEEGIYTGAQLSRNYAVYPYASGTRISEDGTVSYTLPDTQAYAENSFGLGANVMCAATADLEDTDLLFFNALGYFEINIYGSATIKKIVFTSGGDLPLSGPAEISVPYHAGPTLTMREGGSSSVTLDCGDGVALGATAETATKFVIMVPPTDFTSGFSLEITDTEGKVMTKSTTNTFDIQRNKGISMNPFEMAGTTPDPGPGPDPEPDPDPEIPEMPYDSRETAGMPILYVFTPDNTPVNQKDTWIEHSHAYLREADGVTITDLGEANIRGRGNTTWNYIKKPYAFKLDKKAELLGMPSDKRWDLLANYLDRTRLRNDLALELGRRLKAKGVPGLDWTPQGKFVELYLNGEFLGNYYLCEHIKISKKRVPITEMKSTDIDEESITGGYLLECGTEMDMDDKHQPESTWQHQFYTGAHSNPLHGSNYRIPVMIKDPDEDVIVPEQYNYIKNYVNSAQSSIINGRDWTEKIDLDSFICWMVVQEVVDNYEPTHPKSAYMHKDRNGKLMMGPLWDFDYNTFNGGGTPVYHYSLWYPFLYKNATFRDRLKELWPQISSALREVKNDYAARFQNGNQEIMPLAVSIDKDWARWKQATIEAGGNQPSVNGDEDNGIWTAFTDMFNSLGSRINLIGNEEDLGKPAVQN